MYVRYKQDRQCTVTIRFHFNMIHPVVLYQYIIIKVRQKTQQYYISWWSRLDKQSI